MVYRSFTPLATRKSPAFRGLSLELDGISDFISFSDQDGDDAGGAGAFRHAIRHSTQLATHANYAPQTWLFWVKFPQSTLTDVITHSQQYGADMLILL